MTRAERVAQAQALRDEGLMYREIAEQLGVAVQTAHEYVNDPDLAKAHERKARGQRSCVDCGTPTNLDGRRTNPNLRCRDCDDQRRLDPAWRKRKAMLTVGRVTWTDEQILDALRSVADGDSLPVAAYEAARAKRKLPSPPWIAMRFGSWAEAKRRAGLTVGAGGNANHHAWTPEQCLDAVLTLARELREPPTYNTYLTWHKDHPEHPCGTIVRRRLGGWRGVIELCEVELGGAQLGVAA